ncbi:hypothetical protein [Streptomyces sp. NPDC007100]|uniref:hypothetical protein n=1 Tax=unclassified Streptomyces TaxID=2593676 RepID=UPI00340DD973
MISNQRIPLVSREADNVERCQAARKGRNDNRLPLPTDPVPWITDGDQGGSEGAGVQQPGERLTVRIDE